MRVQVLFFGILKDLVGRGSDELTLPEHAKAGDVVEHYERSIPAMGGMLASIAISVNQEYSDPGATLHAGDEIALLPPVSGGSAEIKQTPLETLHAATGRVAITRDAIETAAWTAKIKQPEDGATVVFEGIVRNHSRGRRTLFLDYEAYEEMALKQMQSLLAQALSEFQIRDAAIVHRLGRLQIGETSVLILVASAHRAAAFDACRWLIDTLKRTVPIWKKEYLEDGVVWADGEPFPEPLASGSHTKTPASK
jgi:molybdopterin synthase catalytic subunit/molybdopterin converting factor small subunit